MLLKAALYVFALTFLFACAFQIIGRLLINYDVKNGHIRLLLFSYFPVFIVPIDQDLEAEELPLIKTVKPNLSRVNFTNRFVGRVIEVRRKKGFIRRFTLTPDDPVSFLNQIRHVQTVNSNKSQSNS